MQSSSLLGFSSRVLPAGVTEACRNDRKCCIVSYLTFGMVDAKVINTVTLCYVNGFRYFSRLLLVVLNKIKF